MTLASDFRPRPAPAYNGPGYKDNNYDLKLEAAYEK